MKHFILMMIIILTVPLLPVVSTVTTDAALTVSGYKNASDTPTSSGSYSLQLQSYLNTAIANESVIVLDPSKHATASSSDSKFFSWTIGRTFDSSAYFDFPSYSKNTTIGTLSFTIGLLKASYNGSYYNPAYDLTFAISSQVSSVVKDYYLTRYKYTPSLVSTGVVNQSVQAGKNQSFSGSVFSYDFNITRSRKNNATVNYDLEIGGNGSILISSLHSDVQNLQLTYTAPVVVEFTVQ